jgi:F0F1-type ATP synthase beta subunit
MDSTDGLVRGLEVEATGLPIQMPSGEAIKGRLFNVVGEAIDGIGPVPVMPGKGFQFTVKHQDLKIFLLYRGTFHRYQSNRLD